MGELQIYANSGEVQFKKQLKLLERQCTDDNRRIIMEYFGYLKATLNVNGFRSAKILWQMRIIANTLSKTLDKVSIEDIDNLFTKLRTKKRGLKRTKKGVVTYEKKDYYSDVTLSEYLKATKRFYKYLLKKKNREYRNSSLVNMDKKKSMEEISYLKDLNDELEDRKGYVKKKDKRRLVGDILTPEEVEKMVKYANTPRDKLFLTLLYEIGCRIGEFLNIRLKDISRGDNFYKVRLDGKTGERFNMFVHSIPFFENYMQIHPFKNDKEAPLWLCFGTCNHLKNLKYVGAKKLILRYLKKANINKKITPHSFRRSRATELAQYLTETQLCEHFGWVIGSGIVGVYVRKSGRNINRAMLNYYGLEVDDIETKENIRKKLKTPKKCGVCDTINTPDSAYCSKCGKALTLEVALNGEEQVKNEMDKTMKFIQEIMSNPELLKQFNEFRNSEMMNQFNSFKKKQEEIKK